MFERYPVAVDVVHARVRAGFLSLADCPAPTACPNARINSGSSAACLVVRECVFKDCHTSHANDDGGAVLYNGEEFRAIDTTFDNCSVYAWGGAICIQGKFVVLRCCGRLCTARVGTMIYFGKAYEGSSEFSQLTMHSCGIEKTWPTPDDVQTGGIYFDANAEPFFNHMNQTSNILVQNRDVIGEGRRAAIYSQKNRKGFNCTFLTLFNNSGNAIIDCGQGLPARFSYANIILNFATDGFTVVYSTIIGMILTQCIFLDNRES
jgi:hypothetical protein